MSIDHIAKVVPARRRSRPKVSEASGAAAKKSEKYDPWLTPAEAASYVGMHVETIREKIRLREIAASKSGNGPSARIRIRVGEMDRWMRSREVPAL